MASKSFLRVFFVVVIGLSSIGLAYGYTLGATNDTFESHLTNQGVANPQQQAVDPRDNITVIATDSNSWRGEASSGPRARAELVAFDPDGSVLYYNDSHTRYWDVDPVPGTRTTVEYMFADHLAPSACPDTTNFSQRRVDEEVWNEYEDARSTDACTRNGIERVNLTTGETTRVWSETTPGKEATRYHDADRLPNGHTLITDSNGNRVFEVDEQGEVVWRVNIAFPYEAERLGTGDESAGGSSATQANLDSRTGSLSDRVLIFAKQLIPGKYLNGLMYITPVWMGFLEVLELVGLLTSCLLWAGIEVVWRREP